MNTTIDRPALPAARESSALPAYAQLFLDGLKEAGVSLVAALPESLLKRIYRACEDDGSLQYVAVTNEAELPGIVAGTYLSGKRAVMIMENSGLRQACEPIARFSFCHGMPMVMVMAYRGDLGERNWWGHNHAQTMEPLLKALRIPYWIVDSLDEIKPSLAKALVHTDSSQWPVALIMTGECIEGGVHEAH